jgi:hypothetical protein
MYNTQSPGVVSKQMLTYRRLNEAISVIASNVSSPVKFVPNHRNEILIGDKGPYQAIFRLHSGQVFPILITEANNDSVESSYPHAFVLKESYFSGTEQVICMEHEREFVRDLRAWADQQWANLIT